MNNFFGWLGDNADRVTTLFIDHVQLSVIPLVLGLAIALPLGWLARRYRWLYPPMVGAPGCSTRSRRSPCSSRCPASLAPRSSTRSTWWRR